MAKRRKVWIPKPYDRYQSVGPPGGGPKADVGHWGVGPKVKSKAPRNAALIAGGAAVVGAAARTKVGRRVRKAATSRGRRAIGRVRGKRQRRDSSGRFR